METTTTPVTVKLKLVEGDDGKYKLVADEKVKLKVVEGEDGKLKLTVPEAAPTTQTETVTPTVGSDTTQNLMETQRKIIILKALDLIGKMIDLIEAKIEANKASQAFDREFAN